MTICAACDNPTTELFGDRNDLCGTCDELGVSTFVDNFEVNDFNYFDDEDDYDFDDDLDMPYDTECLDTSFHDYEMDV